MAVGIVALRVIIFALLAVALGLIGVGPGVCNTQSMPMRVSTIHCAYDGYITIGGLVRTFGYGSRQEWDTRFLSGVQAAFAITLVALLCSATSLFLACANAKRWHGPLTLTMAGICGLGCFVAAVLAFYWGSGSALQRNYGTVWGTTTVLGWLVGGALLTLAGSFLILDALLGLRGGGGRRRRAARLTTSDSVLVYPTRGFAAPPKAEVYQSSPLEVQVHSPIVHAIPIEVERY